MLPVCTIHTIDHAACLPVSAWIDGDHPEGICPLVDFPLEKRNLFTVLCKWNVLFKQCLRRMCTHSGIGYGTVPRRYPYNFQVSSSCFLHLPPHVTFTSISLPSPPATFSRKSRLGLYLPLSRREIFDFLVPTFSASRSCVIPCSFRTCRSCAAISCLA